MGQYRIGQVARRLGEQPHTLRHWERQFGVPRPSRGRFGERLYSEADIAVLQRIQHLLRVERRTLEEARRIFCATQHMGMPTPEQLRKLHHALRALQLLLEPLEGH